MRNLFIGIIVFLTLGGCKYDHDEVIEYGIVVLDKYKSSLIQLIDECNDLAEEECETYNIAVSQSTDYFSFKEYDYIENENVIELGMLLDINESTELRISNLIPRDEISELIFMKNIYVSFNLHIRDIYKQKAKLIYIIDKEAFGKLFADRIFYSSEELGNVEEEKEWIYMIDKNWAITSTFIYMEMAKEKCKKTLE